MTEHLTESREDLEQRFLIMGQFVIRAQSLTVTCMNIGCPSCRALHEGLPIPPTVLAVAQEPREDLEEAVVSINDRLETVVEMLDNGCPGREFIVVLLTGATERLDDA